MEGNVRRWKTSHARSIAFTDEYSPERTWKNQRILAAYSRPVNKGFASASIIRRNNNLHEFEVVR